MPYTCFLFVIRKPGITPEQFKDYYETKHIPLMKAHAGNLWPVQTRRYYIAHTGEETNHAPVVLLGSADAFKYDAIVDYSFPDQATFETFFAHMSQPEFLKKREADEDNFLERSKLLAVAIDSISPAP